MYTSTSTKAMLEELDNDPEAGKKGFVSDMVVLFPLEKTRYTGIAQFYSLECC